MRINRISAIGVVGCVSALLATYWLSVAPTTLDDSFVTLMGRTIELRQWRGLPVVVTFWATDCPACVNEIPELIALYRRYHAEGLEMIAVNAYYDPPSHVVALTAAKQLPYPVALDIDAGHARRFGGVYLTPSTFLLAPDGTVDRRYTGAFDAADLSARIEYFLKDKSCCG